MTGALRALLSASILGGLLAGVIFAIKPLIKNRVSKAFLYYIWLFALLKLCLPFGFSLPVLSAQATPDISVSAVDTAAPAAEMETHISPEVNAEGGAEPSAPGAPAQDAASGVSDGGGRSDASPSVFTGRFAQLLKSPGFWLALWGAGAGISLAWHVLGYIRFRRTLSRYEIAPDERDMEIFRGFPESGKIRLFCSEYVKTPLLAGLFRPVIVLPGGAWVKNGRDGELRNILLHEMTHYRRRDILYKWFAMAVCCVHWFNPAAYFVKRELALAGELACDEAVVRSMTGEEKRAYGESLIAMAASHALPRGIPATTMCEGKKQLTERLVFIMKKKLKRRLAAVLSIALAVCLAGCAAVGGVNQSGGGAAPEGTGSGVSDGDAAQPDASLDILEADGFQLAIPAEYSDRLLVFTQRDEGYGAPLFHVYEKQSYEESRAAMPELYEDDSGAGFLFGIVRCDRAEYEQGIDSVGLSFFARDEEYYYGHTFATDVQFFRSDIDIYTEEAMAEWTELYEQVDGILADFIARNGLEAYSDSEFYSLEFTYDSPHMYVTYYPYFSIEESLKGAYTFVLSQPAAQGEGGIWCVERWYDEYGNTYYCFPAKYGLTELSAEEYFAALQADCDAGLAQEQLDPMQVCRQFAEDYFGHSPTEGSFHQTMGLPYVKADYASDELLARTDAYDEFIAEESDYQVKVVFTASSPVKNFQFLDLTLSGDGLGFDIQGVRFSADSLTPETPLVIGTVFPGDMPTQGISYEDKYGRVRNFALSMSGLDGSLLLTEF